MGGGHHGGGDGADFYADAAREVEGMNRPGFVGGSHFQIGWSPYEQNNEQILP
jgi:hypothetical protein